MKVVIYILPTSSTTGFQVTNGWGQWDEERRKHVKIVKMGNLGNLKAVSERGGCCHGGGYLVVVVVAM